jgi:hypothetical protein
MLVAAEALLGRKVVDARGQDVGVVVDVGTGERWAPKFLLVNAPPRADGKPAYVRVEMREVVGVSGDVLTVRAVN